MSAGGLGEALPWFGDVMYQPRTPTAETARMETVLISMAERVLEGRGGKGERGEDVALTSGESSGVTTEMGGPSRGVWTTMMGGPREARHARRR